MNILGDVCAEDVLQVWVEFIIVGDLDTESYTIQQISSLLMKSDQSRFEKGPPESPGVTLAVQEQPSGFHLVEIDFVG